MFRIAALLLTLAPLPALADEKSDVPAAPPARHLNHLAYGESEREALAPVAVEGGGCLLRREASDDLQRMLARAAAEGIRLEAVSCFRSIEYQRRVFCKGAGDCDAAAAERARYVGPPGHSEHATGYAVDFSHPGVGCPAVEQCFAMTPGGKWLMRNAVEFGFELSFPAGNKQGVAWEPWHWRWVGRTGDARAEVAAARKRFAIAQASFPALPSVLREVAPPPIARVTPPRWAAVAAMHSLQFARVN